VATTLGRTQHQYRVSMSDAFSSTWLPTMAPISRIVAAGDWRYDDSTMDFIAGDSDLDTAGESYTMTGVKLDLSVDSLVAATSTSGLVSKEYTALPPGIPSLVRTLANEVTQNAPSRFEKAVALQQWFREDGGFT
jgi:transglutaminase-like putative cysteine protease